MTKTEKVNRARSIRSHLARFTDLQDTALQEHAKSQGVVPEHVAMKRLLSAQKELNELIEKLQQEGYGQKA